MHVFLSWSGEIARVAAEAFHDWLRDSLPNRVKIYLSGKSNVPGELWRQLLKSAFSQSSVGVFFLTRESIAAPWVLFEGGAISKLRRSRVFTVLLDLTASDLARLSPPFEQYQAVDFELDGFWRVFNAIYKRAKISKPVNDLRDSFDEWWSGTHKSVQSTIDAGLTGAGDWALVSQASVASRIARSPFEAEHLFRVAKHRLDFIAQNHYSITVEKEKEHLSLLRDFLKQSGREVRFLAMNPRNSAAVQSWTKLMGTKNFPNDLRKAVASLRKWKKTASDEHWKGKLEIRLSGLIPTSMTFVDGESNHGLLVVTPMGRKPSNTDRSVFSLQRTHNREAFDGYWTT